MTEQTMAAAQWRFKHLLLPMLFGVFMLGVIEIFNIDIVLAKWLFSLEGGVQWHLRHQAFFEQVLHKGGRQLITLMSIVLLVVVISCQLVPRWRHYRRSLLMVMLSVTSTILLVRYGKSITNVSCPWDLTMFGGNKPLVMFPNTLFSQQTLGQCYPGGHSSGAFAWVVLYYFALVNKPQWRKHLLSLAIGMGLCFAATQELRGAHFLSHDLTSLWLAWLIATSYYGLMYRPWQNTVSELWLNGVSPNLKLTPVKQRA